MVDSSGQRRRARIRPVGTPPSRPPNEDSPPCHTWRIPAGSAVYVERFVTTWRSRAPTIEAATIQRKTPVNQSVGYPLVRSLRSK